MLPSLSPLSPVAPSLRPSEPWPARPSLLWALNLCSASPACGDVFCFIFSRLFFFFINVFFCLFCLRVAVSVVPFNEQNKYKQPSQDLQQAQPAERVSRAVVVWGLWQGDPGPVGWQSCRWHLCALKNHSFTVPAVAGLGGGRCCWGQKHLTCSVSQSGP